MRLEGLILNNELVLVSFLNEGAAGEVYRAKAIRSFKGIPEGAQVAVKIYKPAILNSPKESLRIERELEAGLEIQHPNLVKTLAIGSYAGAETERPYLVMEFLEGFTLRKYVEIFGVPEEKEMISLFGQIVKGVSFLHKNGWVHRDIKPDNIMVLKDGSLKIMDFGVIRNLKDATITSSDEFLGTIRYAAPEYLFELKADDKTDAYSVGGALYFMLFGKDLFSEIRLFSKLVQEISSKSPPLMWPPRVQNKKACLLIEIARRLLTHERERRMGISEAISQLEASIEGTLWKDYIIPLIRYRCASIWSPYKGGFPENPIMHIETTMGFLPEEYFSHILNSLDESGWLSIYLGGDVEYILTMLPGMRNILAFDGIDIELDEWKQRFLSVHDVRQKGAYVRALLCTAVLAKDSYQYGQMQNCIKWAKTTESSEAFAKLCDQSYGWLNTMHDIYFT
jgi:serine/threonine protein kinase